MYDFTFKSGPCRLRACTAFAPKPFTRYARGSPLTMTNVVVANLRLNGTMRVSSADSSLARYRRLQYRKREVTRAIDLLYTRAKLRVDIYIRRDRSLKIEILASKARSDATSGTSRGKQQRGFYDLTRARTQESGSITRVEEFGLSSVSEEANVSDVERPASASPGSGKASVNGAKTSDRRSRSLRSNLRQKTASSDDILETRTRLQHPPVSFSMDKLCSDAENEDENETKTATMPAVAGDAETSRDHAGKGGLIKRRMLGSIRGLMASTHLLQTYEPEEVLHALSCCVIFFFLFCYATLGRPTCLCSCRALVTARSDMRLVKGKTRERRENERE